MSARNNEVRWSSKLSIASAVFAVFALAVMAFSSTASAAVVRPFVEEFGSAEKPSLNQPIAVAVDQQTGDVYVAEYGGTRSIRRFHANGTPAKFGALASNVIDGAPGEPDATPEGEFTFFNPPWTQIAIDESGGPTNGDIYVTPQSNGFGVIYIFNSEGEYIGLLSEFHKGQQAAGPFQKMGGTRGVAIDSSGNVYVTDSVEKQIHKFAPSGGVVSNAGSVANFRFNGTPGHVNVGSGPTAGYLFVSGEGEESSGQSPSGKYSASTGEKIYSMPGGAVDPSTGRVVAENGEEIDASGASPSLYATLQEASGVTASGRGVAVNGATETAYLLSNERIQLYGPDVTKATVTTKPTTGITASRATLNGVVNPSGLAVTECKFEYDTALEAEHGNYSHSAPCEGSLPTDSADHPVSASLTGLEESSAVSFSKGHYGFRLVATDANGTSFTTKGEFVTASRATIAPATNVVEASATLNGTVFPEGEQLESCEFEYSLTSNEPYESSIPCAESVAEIGEGIQGVAVHADISGLNAETTYHFRLVDMSPAGAIYSADRAFRTPGSPRVSEAHANQVGEEDAELEAIVNPAGLPTEYVVEYGTTASYGLVTNSESAGSEEGEHHFAIDLTGLQPGTTYHWRLVATNSLEEVVTSPDLTFTTFEPFLADTSCANQALRNGESAALPDCRAYEMVSPAAKTGEVIPPAVSAASCSECIPGSIIGRQPIQAALDGNSFAFEGQAFSAGLAPNADEYISKRTSEGWKTTPLSVSKNSAFKGFEGFGPDLSRSVSYQNGPVALSPDAPEKNGKAFTNLYLHEEGQPPVPLVAQAPPHREAGETFPGENKFQVQFQGGNAGTSSVPTFTHLVFEANDTLTGATADAPAPVDGGDHYGNHLLAQQNLYEWSNGGLKLINVLPGNTTTEPGAVIGSGELALESTAWEEPRVENAISADGSHIFWSNNTTGQLYVRIDGTETVEVLDHTGKFLRGSVDGSHVLLNDGCLYSLASESCEDLTGGQGGFVGMLGTSSDLSRVYYVDTAALTGAEVGATGQTATAGKNNLYLWTEGAPKFVATLDKSDNYFGGISACCSNSSDWSSLRSRTAQATPDGSLLTFMSRAHLTGYDNTSAACPEGFGVTGGCPQVFEYSVDKNEVFCASCNPTGARPLGQSFIPSVEAGEQGYGPFGELTALPERGEGRLFFDSLDVLSPRDKNGRIIDVYEWTPDGVGDCSHAGGCQSLISTGNSPNDSFFAGSDASGANAFFITRQKLVAADQDDYLDLYDARIEGGFAEKAPPCEGEACRGPASSVAVGESPGSASFVGPENEKPTKKKHHKKKHHKKKHHKKQKAHKKKGHHKTQRVNGGKGDAK